MSKRGVFKKNGSHPEQHQAAPLRDIPFLLSQTLQECSRKVFRQTTARGVGPGVARGVHERCPGWSQAALSGRGKGQASVPGPGAQAVRLPPEQAPGVAGDGQGQKLDGKVTVEHVGGGSQNAVLVGHGVFPICGCRGSRGNRLQSGRW